MDGLVEWLKELAVFIVLCETILSFTPSGVYKRYIKPFVGLILLLRISSLLIGTVEVDWNERVNTIFAGYEQSVSQYLQNVPVIEEEKISEKDFYDQENSGEVKLKEELISVDKIIISPIKIGEE